MKVNRKLISIKKKKERETTFCTKASFSSLLDIV